MKISEIIAAILTIFVTTPIWLFLLYSILKMLQPDRLVWFLYWIYVPLSIISGILIGVVSKIEEEK